VLGIVVGTAVTDGSGFLYDMHPRASEDFSVVAYLPGLNCYWLEGSRDRERGIFCRARRKKPALDPHSD
jgi:hypothetical protein